MRRPILLAAALLLAGAPALAEDRAEDREVTDGIALTGRLGFGIARGVEDTSQSTARTRAIGRLDGAVTARTTLDNGLTLGLRFDLDESVGD